MKSKVLLFLTAVLLLGGCRAEAQQFTWKQQISSSCTGLTSSTSCGGIACGKQDLCWDTTQKIMYTCDPASGSTCTTAADWKAGGGGWLATSTTLVPLVTASNVGIGTPTPLARLHVVGGNFKIGSNLYQCDASNGCRFDVNNDNSTDVTISAAGVFATSGGYTYTGTNPSMNVARATDKSSPVIGDAWYNTAYPAWVYWNGSILKRIPTELVHAVTVTPVASSNTLLWKAPYNSRIETINCIVDPGGSSSAVVNIQKCNGDGSACTNVDTASITCGNTNSADDGSLNSPSVTANSWVNLNLGTVTGSPAKLSVTVKYSTQP